MSTIVLDTADVMVSRYSKAETRGPLSLLSDMYVERGGIEDWNLLHELHYKAESLGIGPKIWRCCYKGETIGVAVFTIAKSLSKERNRAFKYMKPNQGGMDTTIINTHRMKNMNQWMLCNSRLVIDTMYRGAGIAYRFQNIAARMTGMACIEFQSSMSKFNPFAERSGFRFVPPMRSNAYKAGLAFFDSFFKSNPQDSVALLEEFDAMPEWWQPKVRRALEEWFYKNSAMEKTGENRDLGTSRVEGRSTKYLVEQCQQLTFATPLYGVYVNPDYKTALPDRIPLTAFDRTPTDQPLSI